MSHQERTWVKTSDEQTGKPRWNVLVNGKPVPGGFVLELGEEQFEAHYPHIEPFVKPTLREAQERLEWAPPITHGVSRIGAEIDDDPAGFVSVGDAAAKLGVSAFRVNAMVANGKLAARRAPDGSAQVGCSSLEALLAKTNGDDVKEADDARL